MVGAAYLGRTWLLKPLIQALALLTNCCSHFDILGWEGHRYLESSESPFPLPQKTPLHGSMAPRHGVSSHWWPHCSGLGLGTVGSRGRALHLKWQGLWQGLMIINGQLSCCIM